jgi:formylglycine-generating enzyme required for sulfatase activity
MDITYNILVKNTLQMRNISILSLFCLLFACDNEKTQPIEMVAVPSLELLSDKSVGKDSSQKIQISLESFYISNEITNKEYREFTDWVKNNPDQILVRTKEIKGSKNEFGKTRIWTIPVLIGMDELLPKVIDSSSLYKLDKSYKNYFTDEKYDDYPVVGVSRNNAEYFCCWKTNFEFVWKKVGHGKSKIYTARGPETHFRLPQEIEWEYVAKQPLKKSMSNDHSIRKVDEGNTNKWGISHLVDNVSEWVMSSDDTLAISRGGSWRTNSNISDRERMDPDSSSGNIGFRIVRTFTPIGINKKPNK